MKPGQSFRCDIFCHVVDNFGDIGVAWRLASQLHREFGFQVRVIVDDLASLHKLLPPINTGIDAQVVDGIAVLRWHPAVTIVPAELVIETFGCELPEAYIVAMSGQPKPPIWINLEYLSAEGWVDSHHLLPSIHPATGLRKYFFFPGFGNGTGGLIREQGLFAARNSYLQQRTTGSLNLDVFVFGYETAALPALLAAIGTDSANGRRIHCCFAEGNLASKARQFMHESRLEPAIQFAEFVAQKDFDKVLWENDVLFVRGEDSFVRAQWAAKPFIWQIYPQDQDAHWVKLDAFLGRYCRALPDGAAAALRRVTRAWNAGDAADFPAAWRGFIEHLDILRIHAERWAEDLAKLPDLATNLMTFCEKTAKI